MEPTANLSEPMDTQESLDRLKAEAPARIEAVDSVDALDELAAELTGKRSPIAEGRRSLGSVPAEDRRELGRAINDVAVEVDALLAARRSLLEAAEAAEALASDRVDVTLPGRAPARGTMHVIQQVMDEIVDIFVAMGYTAASGPEVETEFYNFTALNFGAAHP